LWRGIAETYYLLECKLPSHFGLKTSVLSYSISPQLQEYGNALRTHKEPPKSTDPTFTPILNALSTDWEARLDEVTAMLVTTEACVGKENAFFMFPSVIEPNKGK